MTEKRSVADGRKIYETKHGKTAGPFHPAGLAEQDGEVSRPNQSTDGDRP
jgi:hypothetical protein